MSQSVNVLMGIIFLISSARNRGNGIPCRQGKLGKGHQQARKGSTHTVHSIAQSAYLEPLLDRSRRTPRHLRRTEGVGFYQSNRLA